MSTTTPLNSALIRRVMSVLGSSVSSSSPPARSSAWLFQLPSSLRSSQTRKPLPTTLRISIARRGTNPTDPVDRDFVELGEALSREVEGDTVDAHRIEERAIDTPDAQLRTDLFADGALERTQQRIPSEAIRDGEDQYPDRAAHEECDECQTLRPAGNDPAPARLPFALVRLAHFRLRRHQNACPTDRWIRYLLSPRFGSSGKPTSRPTGPIGVPKRRPVPMAVSKPSGSQSFGASCT